MDPWSEQRPRWDWGGGESPRSAYPPPPTEPPYGFPPFGSGPQPPTPAPPSHRGWFALVAVILGFALILSGAAIGYGASRMLSILPAGNSGPLTLLPATSNGQLSTDQIANKVDPAVVDINTVVQGFRSSGEAAGTGMIVGSWGEVMTNNHVVKGATSIRVTLPTRGSTYTARVVGVDSTADVALIQLQGASGLPTVSFANSSTLKVGQKVVAIGNALGQGGTPSVTSGSITALDRSITASDGSGGAEQLSNMIQTDASISPGDSGGPLVNTSGQVVGMVTAGAAQGFASNSTSVGFAIPATNAVSVVNDVKSGNTRGGEIVIGQAGYIGVAVTDLDQATASQLGYPNVSSGALVEGVTTGGPAEKAGIARLAVITAAAGRAVTSAADLGRALQAHKPGEAVSVTWVDQGGSHTTSITLTSGPAA